MICVRIFTKKYSYSGKKNKYAHVSKNLHSIREKKFNVGYIRKIFRGNTCWQLYHGKTTFFATTCEFICLNV